jgi:uncharacterized protein
MTPSHFYLKQIVVMVSSVLLLLTTAHAASFDCEKARSKVEKLICSDKKLSRLDETLNKAYQKALKRNDIKKVVLEIQRSWLKSVRDTCRNSDCIRKLYESRINSLRMRLMPRTATSAEPVSGTYTYATSIRDWSTIKETYRLAESSMTLSLKDKNTFHFDLQIMGGNYHTCSLSGVAVRRGRFWEYRGTKPLFDNPEDCILKFWFEGNSVRLECDGGLCRNACGARAGFDGRVLYR